MKLMCFNCGCFNPADTMGNLNNITEQTWQNLADHLNQPVEQVKKSILQQLINNQPGSPELEEIFTTAAKAWGQSILEAKLHTMELLQTQVKI